MSDVSAVKALVFDVFGTVVDWRTSLINDFTKWGEANGKKADWTALVDGWRAVYAASMDVVRKNPQAGYVIVALYGVNNMLGASLADVVFSQRAQACPFSLNG